MPYTLHWEPEGVLRRLHGRVTAAERRQSLEAICADPRFDGLRYAITDYLEVSEFGGTLDDNEEIAALHVAPLITNPAIVIVGVATDPGVLAGIAHFKALGFIGDQPYEVFATVAEARAWIDSHPRPVVLLRGRLRR